MKEKKKNPLFLGILSIILGLLFSWGGGIGLSITSLLYANSLQKESGLDYKTEKIIAIVGIVLSALNWIIGIILHMS
ncbi:DUF4190 domain-containing protein [uncultured Streptococcus sp.]|uniref:DUF4190 domain-containing protein n=1 Tax=uncultured Streptococcus sp. TaxID=83427 RepID=UPI001A59267D|nr:DUF4190 domain-containing protein [uncultured Streptococcus sp.]VTY24391.1 Uncharacterised protein [uncultured Streptococcus sp.]